MKKRKIKLPHGKERDGILQPNEPSTLNTPEEFRSSVRNQKSNKQLVNEHFNSLEKECVDILKKAGFDPNNKEKEYSLPNDVIASFNAAIDITFGISPEMLAKDILIEIDQLRRSIDKTNLFRTIRIVLAIEEARTKLFLFTGKNEMAYKLGLDFLSTRENLGTYTRDQRKEWEQIYYTLNKMGKPRTWVRDQIIKGATFKKQQIKPQRTVYDYIKNVLEKK